MNVASLLFQGKQLYLMPMTQLDPYILENLYPSLLACQLPILNKDFPHASVVDINEQLWYFNVYSKICQWLEDLHNSVNLCF